MGHYSRQEVLVVAQGMELPIQKYADKKAVKTLIHSAILFCADNYTGATNLSEELMKECALFVNQHFYAFGVEEIKQAFRLAASGETSVDLNTYYGKFNVTMLGNVLNAYKDHRLNIAKAIEKENDFLNQKAKEDFFASPQGIELIKAQINKRIDFLKRYPLSASAKDYDQLYAYDFIYLSQKEKDDFLATAKAEILLNESRTNTINEDFINEQLLEEYGITLEVKAELRAKKLAVLKFIENLKS